MQSLSVTLLRLLVTLLVVSTSLTAVIITAGPDEPPDRSNEVENRVCAGTCFSSSLPQTDPVTPGDEELNFCNSCQPSLSNWIEVTLSCMQDEVAYEVTKKVQQIVNCSCSDCILNNEPVIVSDEGKKAPDFSPAVLPIVEDIDSSGDAPAEVEQNEEKPKENGSDVFPPFDRLVPEETDDLLGPPYQELPGPNLLQEDIQFTPEGESDPNLLTEDNTGSDSELKTLMNNLNVMLSGSGPVDIHRLSIKEIRSIVSDLETSKVKDTSGDNPNSSLDDQDDEAHELAGARVTG